MSTPVRIKDDVYSRLELNAKGYESVSETISRSIDSLEAIEFFNMVCSQVESSIDTLRAEGKVATREKVLLVHYKTETIEKVMTVVEKIYDKYQVSYTPDINQVRLLVELK